jgi:hypothetical protein
VRIQLPHVPDKQCHLQKKENGEFIISNLNAETPTQVNGLQIEKSYHLRNNDVIKIYDRLFRFEYPENSLHSKHVTMGNVERLPLVSQENLKNEAHSLSTPKLKQLKRDVQTPRSSSKPSTGTPKTKKLLSSQTPKSGRKSRSTEQL